MSQNIFDDPVFFESYYKLRQGLNYNDLFEQPVMRRLLPDVAGKCVLDIGCGYGHNCLDFAQKGAQRVLGIDLSEKCSPWRAANPHTRTLNTGAWTWPIFHS